MKLTSTAFTDGGKIPRRHACDGEDLSPPLKFSEVPASAKSLAVVVDDPDAPGGTFDHWISWNMPATMNSLPEGCSLPYEGTNHFGSLDYRGPCPPRGPVHHYHFKGYALDAMLELRQGASKEELEDAMKGHVVASVELVGTYQR